jgi:hypothetical protein
LRDSSVLMNAIADGMTITTWVQDTFAFADVFDEVAGRYKGLRGGKFISVTDTHSTALVVKSSVAHLQLDIEGGAPSASGTYAVLQSTLPKNTGGGTEAAANASAFHRYHGTVQLDATRVGRDAGRIAEEVIAHLTGQIGVEVTVTLEIEAKLLKGATDQIVRTVTENSRTLKFTSYGFEID